jgi:hypothetical protein
MIVRVRSGPALVVALATATAACAPADATMSRSPEPASTRPPPSRAEVMDRDRGLVGGLATSLALGVAGLGTMLAGGIYATPPQHAEPHQVPPITIAGGVMSLGFLAAIPLAIALERHRARNPEYFQRRRASLPRLSF